MRSARSPISFSSSSRCRSRRSSRLSCGFWMMTYSVRDEPGLPLRAARDVVAIARLDAIRDSLGAAQPGRRGIPQRAPLHRAPAAAVAQQRPLLGTFAGARDQLDDAQAEIVAGRIADLDRPRRRQLQPVRRAQDLDARRAVGLGGQVVAARLAHSAAEGRLQPEPVARVFRHRQLGDQQIAGQVRRDLTLLAVFAEQQQRPARVAQRVGFDAHARPLDGGDVAGRALDGARRQAGVPGIAVGDAHVADQRHRRHRGAFKQRRPVDQRAQAMRELRRPPGARGKRRDRDERGGQRAHGRAQRHQLPRIDRRHRTPDVVLKRLHQSRGHGGRTRIRLARLGQLDGGQQIAGHRRQQHACLARRRPVLAQRARR